MYAAAAMHFDNMCEIVLTGMAQLCALHAVCMQCMTDEVHVSCHSVHARMHIAPMHVIMHRPSTHAGVRATTQRESHYVASVIAGVITFNRSAGCMACL